ncbi:hypothetical protein [Arthrobacter sp. B1805]|uniref:hypothetical protein n=1 Tax=Arthrobacter sp. B1805 TaxID=2058892 RepID=UPI000CE2E43B|nr:hypothetical protein [Arthrobacter sp. B1805]
MTGIIGMDPREVRGLARMLDASSRSLEDAAVGRGLVCPPPRTAAVAMSHASLEMRMRRDGTVDDFPMASNLPAVNGEGGWAELPILLRWSENPSDPLVPLAGIEPTTFPLQE